MHAHKQNNANKNNSGKIKIKYIRYNWFSHSLDVKNKIQIEIDGNIRNKLPIMFTK